MRGSCGKWFTKFDFTFILHINRVLFLILHGLGDALNFTVNIDGKTMPGVKFFRAGRELREDTRTAIVLDEKNKTATLKIKKTRTTDEAKYTVNLEQGGAVTDTGTFSVFIKGG